MSDRFRCPECGSGVVVDEDGCCAQCGSDTTVMPAIDVEDDGFVTVYPRTT